MRKIKIKSFRKRPFYKIYNGEKLIASSRTLQNARKYIINAKKGGYYFIERCQLLYEMDKV